LKKLETIEICDVNLILESMCLHNCNDLSEVKKIVLEFYEFDIDYWEEEDGEMMEISDIEALDYLNAHKMLARTMADFWQKQAA